MTQIAHLPFALAAIGGLIGLLSLEFELVFFGVISGYFTAKLVQSLVWTVSGPREAT